MRYVVVILATLLAVRVWAKHFRPRWIHLKSALRHPATPDRVVTPSKEEPSTTGTNRGYEAPPKPKKRKVRNKSNDPYSHGFSGKIKVKLNKPN